MPITYQACLDGQLLCVRMQGRLALSEVDRYRQAVIADPAVSATVPRLIDVRAMDLPPTLADVHELARTLWRPAVHAPARRAVVASRDAVYGMFRMLEVLAERGGAPPVVRTFRGVPEALAWLEVQEAPADGVCAVH